MRMNEDWRIGDELRDEEINANAIIVGIYKAHCENTGDIIKTLAISPIFSCISPHISHLYNIIRYHRPFQKV